MKNKLITAIDVGSSKIITVIANQMTEGKLSVIGVSASASKGLRKGQIIDIDEAVASISASVDGAERMAGISVGQALVSIGGAHIGSLNSKGVVAVSSPSEEITTTDVGRVIDAARAVSLPSSMEMLHILPRDFIVDGQAGIKDPLGMSGVRLEVDTQIVTGSTTAVRNLAKCVNEVGIDVESVLFSGLASSYAVLSDTERELGVILVDIGAGTTDIAIWVEGALAYCAVLPVGARNVTNDIAVGLRLSLESAEQVKLLLSQAEKPKLAVTMESDSKPAKPSDEIDLSDLKLPEQLRKISRKTLVEGIIKPRLLEIFTFVGLEIQKSGLAGLTPSGVVVAGGGAKTVGVLEACRSRLVMPARLGAPFSASSLDEQVLTGLTDELSSAEYSCVVGLLLSEQKGAVETSSRHSSGFSLPKAPSFGNMAQNLNLKNLLGKVTKLLKSFLP